MAGARTIVIVGAGHAGGRAAAALRKAGFDGRLHLVGDEDDPPYERPPLSKDVLADDADPLRGRLHPPGFYDDHRIELTTGRRVLALDPSARRVELAGGGRLAYDRLLLTTGARARTLPHQAAAPDRIVTLRTAADARRIRPLLEPGRRVILVGGGFIGLEVATSAIRRGCSVAVVEAQPRLLSRCVGPAVSDFLARRHAAQGVEIRLGCGVADVAPDGARLDLRLTDGGRLAADLVVVGIGAEPNAELARAAGLACDNGVLVDEYCRTSAPDIFAAGDVAHHPNAALGRRVRLESWENAERQSAAAADAMLDRPAPYGAVPWFWTDQADLNLQIVGLPDASDATVVRGAPDAGVFAVLYLRAARLVAAELVNSGRDRRPVRQLIERGDPVDPAALADPGVPLKQLLGRP